MRQAAAARLLDRTGICLRGIIANPGADAKLIKVHPSFIQRSRST
jgi:hypothetical protein